VAGPHGSGRSTQARLIAEAFDLRYVSAGMVFRERAKGLGLSLEEMSRKAAEDRDFDNYLDSCPLEERVRRIAEREGRDMEEVDKETRFREENELRRFRKLYGVDLEDLSVYDLVVNTGLFEADGVARILKNVVDEYLSCR